MNRREMMGKAILTVPGLGLVVGFASLVGCGGNEGAPVLPSTKTKDELQSSVDLPSGLQVIEKSKSKKKR